MKIQKCFIVVMILILISSMIIVVYTKDKLKNIDYNEYKLNSIYEILPNELYENMFDTERLFIDNQIETVDDLIENSDEVLLINVESSPIFYGDGLINNCKILKVIKGHLRENQSIKIYDLILKWSLSGTIYLGGSTPLKVGNDYVVFLKKSESASMNDTYYFSSILYGHISILGTTKIIEDYDMSLNVNDAMNYQHIFLEGIDKNHIENYKEFCDKILDELNINSLI